MRGPIIKASLMIAALIVSFILLSEAISAVPKIPFIDTVPIRIPGQGALGTGDSGNNTESTPMPPQNVTSGPSLNCSCPGINDSHDLSLRTELFKIFGYTNTSYIRTQAAELYNMTWSSLRENGTDYTGGMIEAAKPSWSPFDVSSFIVEPLMSFEGYIPCTLNTYYLNIDHPLTYYPAERSWYSTEQTSTSFNVQSYVPNIQPDLTGAIPITKPEYLGIPAELRDKLQPLALQITAGQSDSYAKLKSLETYLKTNYVYDLNYTSAPPGVDPVDWFLFTEKRGICSNFNSAFVMLARSIDLPARLVVGYHVNANTEYQVVKANQAHAWSEVPFDGIGWVTFDATGSGELPTDEPSTSLTPLNTTTTITKQDQSCVKGYDFIVGGTVLDEYGSQVDGMRVNIYIKADKSKPGALCGSGLTTLGQFSINCSIPKALPIGEYLIEAHSLQMNDYLGSSSDPPITVLSQTRFEMSVPSKVLVGEGFNVEARLVDSQTNESILSHSRCLVTLTSEHASNTIDAYTNSEGKVQTHFKLSEPGNYTYRVEFKADGYYLGTSQSSIIRSIVPKITIKPLPAIIRGESTVIEGKVHGEDIPVAGAEVLIVGDGIDPTPAVSNPDGVFRIKYNSTVDSRLGPVKFTFSIPTYQTALESCIYARTRILVVGQSSSYWNRPFTVTARLIDDHNDPVSGGNVTLSTIAENPLTIRRLTTENGSVPFSSTLTQQPVSTPTRFNLTFGGVKYYYSSQTGGEITFTTEFNLNGLLPYLIPIIVMLGVAYYIVSNSRTTMGGVLPLLPIEATVTEAPDPLPLGQLKLIERNETLKVSFPQIEAPLPYVWGFGEPLEVMVKLIDHRENAETRETLSIVDEDGMGVTVKTDATGVATGRLTFEKLGRRLITVTHNGGSSSSEAAIGLKIVDYRFEVISLFKGDFEEITKDLEEKRDSYTVREIFDLYTREKVIVELDALKVMFDIFEEANYSTHMVDRSAYVSFYLAKLNYFRGK